MAEKEHSRSFWSIVGRQFRQHPIGSGALYVVAFFAVIGIYAPLLASSKPLFVVMDGEVYFPLFRYLFFTGFYTKRLDIFFNVLMFTAPLLWLCGRRKLLLILGVTGHFVIFAALLIYPVGDPASSPELNAKRQKAIQAAIPSSEVDPLLAPFPQVRSWDFELRYMTPYAQLNRLLRHRQRAAQHQALQIYAGSYERDEKERWLREGISKQQAALTREGKEVPSRAELESLILAQAKPREQAKWRSLPTLWQLGNDNRKKEIERQKAVIAAASEAYPEAKQRFPELKKAYQPQSEAYIGSLKALREAGRGLRQASERRMRGGGGEAYAAAVAQLKEAQATYDEVAAQTSELRKELAAVRRTIISFEEAKARLKYIEDRKEWLDNREVSWEVMPLIRPFHWEDDAGGEQSLNQYVSWWHLTRINRKDLMAGLIFGVRVSMIVGITAVVLSLLIGIPIGAAAGYYGGKLDIIAFRLIEIWESMPVFFMLLMVVAITQSKSIFLVVAVLGIFGWTGFCRYIRGEFLKQRHLPYVDACRAMGFSDARIIFGHVLPNAIPPLLTLLPFSILGAITSEAGLSFLGLGEEGSCSWGVLMDEGRHAFPGESYLLWPPATMLTVLLVAIALVGDALRDALDPKMRR